MEYVGRNRDQEMNAYEKSIRCYVNLLWIVLVIVLVEYVKES